MKAERKLYHFGIIFAGLFLTALLGEQALAAYCSASGGCDEYIYQVQVGTINNNETGCSMYADYTSTYSTEMEAGVGYQITIVTAIGGEPYYGYEGDQLGIWVDWNGDEDFYDADETVYIVSGYGYITTTITPPVGTSAGNKRMRIRLTYTGTVSPCDATTYGEVEDYTITMVSPLGKIRGTKFNDLDADGVYDGGEAGLSGFTIFLDLNNNEYCDDDEPTDVTSPTGQYEFDGLEPGMYIVREVKKSGWKQSFPPGEGKHIVTLSAGEVEENVNFGNYGSDNTIVVIQPIEDTYAKSTEPDTSYGSDNGFASGYSSGAINRSFIKFDLSSIPAGSIVTSARLILRGGFVSIPAPELGVYRIYDGWGESTLTWNNQPSISTGLAATDTSIANIDATVWNVTKDVDGQYVADGVYSTVIKSMNEAVERSASFWSKDCVIEYLHPKLEIDYEPIFGGGTGEPNNPFQIWTCEDMKSIGLYPYRWSKSYKLMTDISLSGCGGSSYNIIGRSSSTTNGSGPFTGIFDGDYHSISGFSYSASSISYVGIFGYVGSNGTIKNLKVISPSLTDAGFNDMTYVGPIAGYASGSSITECAVIGGTVQGKNYVGGLVGLSSGYIASCSSSASVSGGNYIGGLVGGQSSFGGLSGILDCYARGNVSGNSYVGGFIGDSSDVTIVNCYSTGLVSGTTNVGGFSGYNVNQYPIGDNVIGCFWDTTTSNMVTSAAGTGLETPAMQNINTFLDAEWDFAGELDNGGSDAWAMPAGGGYPVLWYELPVPPALPSFAGGSGTIDNPYIIATEEQLNSIGHNARLMDKHFKVISDLDLNGLKYYMIAEKPYVFSGTFDGGDHTISNILVEPVFNLSSVGLVGTLKGPGASIRNLTLIDPNIVSDWGYRVGSLVGVNQSGVITNCHALNINVWGLISVGGLVGNNYWYGTVSNCSATGRVSGNTFMGTLSSTVGGLVGENSYWSEIRGSCVRCDVVGDDCVGGLTGSNVMYSKVTNCYAQGSVTGTSDYIGGLVGRNLGLTHIYYCYSSAEVTGPTGNNSVGGLIGKMGTSGGEFYKACFWNSEINSTLPGIGNGTDPNVIGETTANMQTKNTFTSKGWDFVGESANGTGDIWRMCVNGITYPKLECEFLQADIRCPDGVNFSDFALFANQWLIRKSNRIYWGDGNWGTANYIKSCNLDGSDVTTIRQLTTGFYGAMDVDVDENASQLFWVSPFGMIEKSNLDGSGYQRLTNIANAWCENIFVNELDSKIYFTNSNITDAICSVNLDGSNYTEIIHDYVLCFDIDPVNNKIYYVTLYEYMPPYNNQAGRIWRANLDGSDITKIFEYTSNDWPVGIALNFSQQKIFWIGFQGDFRRADFNGSNAELICSLPSFFYCNNLKIDETNEKMYWIDRDSRKIRRVNLDGTSIEDVLINIGADSYGLDVHIACDGAEHPYPVGDFNKDCAVDYSDLAILCNQWLEDIR